ncbi:MAG: SHOCT domain-containing protein [Caldilineaceae bacterium]
MQPHRRHARGGHGGFGGFFLGGLMSVLWTVLIVLLVLWVTRNWSSISSSVRRAASSLQTSSAPAGTQKPLEILQTRYAKGEITREEYETIRRDLTGEPAPASEPASAPAAETPTTQA